MNKPNDMVRLLELLYAAVSSDTAWDAFLVALGRQCNADIAVLFMHDYRSSNVPFLVSCGMGASLEESYKSHYGAVNPWVAEQECMPEGSVVASHRLASDASICSSEYFADFLRPLDVRYAMGSNILKSDNCMMKLGILRGSKQGPMGEKELGLMSALMPSLQNAMRLRGRLAELQARSRLEWEVVEAMPFGVVFLDRNSTVLRMNVAGREIVAAADGLAMDSRGGITTGRAHDQLWISSTVAAALRGQAQSALPPTLSLPRPSGRRNYSVQVLAVRDTPLSLDGAAHAVLFVCDPERKFEAVEQCLPSLFGLTPAEARLASYLAHGLTLRESAARLGISEGTARCVSKRVFSKTGARGQPDLVRYVITSVAVLGPSPQ